MQVVTKGLGMAGLMLLASAVATGVVSAELERRARIPIDESYSPSADAMIDAWGLPLPAHAGRGPGPIAPPLRRI
jgi:hypothetical protein